MADLLELADDETRAMWNDLRLGYTESHRPPAAPSGDRRDVRARRSGRRPRLRRCRGGDLLPVVGAARARRPRRRDVARLPEPVRGRPGRRRRGDAPRAARGGALVARRRAADRRAPTGDAPRRRQRAAQPDGDAPDRRGVGSSRRCPAPTAGSTSSRTRSTDTSRSTAPIVSPPAPTSSRAASRSASCRSRSRWPGLRIGWLATRDRDVLDRCARMKDYTTICSSAPSEVLALIGLRARDRVLARSRRIVADNLAVLDDLFRRRADRFAWVRPRGGSIAFPRLLGDVPIDDFAAGLVESVRRAAPARLAVRSSGQPLPDRVRPREPARGGRAPRGVPGAHARLTERAVPSVTTNSRSWCRVVRIATHRPHLTRTICSQSFVPPGVPQLRHASGPAPPRRVCPSPVLHAGLCTYPGDQRFSLASC